MTKLRLRAALCVTAAVLVTPAAVFAHITISPLRSMAGATEKYVLRVPNRKQGGHGSGRT